MKTYRFTAKVSHKGTIQIPKNSNLIDKEVDIIIVPKSKQPNSKRKASEFVNKWAGFMSGIDTDKSKFDYLADKYK